MTLRDWPLRLRALIAPRRVERELDEELAFHLEHEAEKLIAGGMSPGEAGRTARARFGPVALAADQCRDQRGTSFIDTTLRDIRYALCTFRRAPTAAATVVGTIAIGLGMIAVAFAFYNTLFLHPDAVRDPAELFTVRRPPQPNAKVWMPFTRHDLDALRRETSVLTDASGIALFPVSPRIDGRVTDAAFVTGNFFQVLGTGATRGRTLLPDDDAPGGGQAVIVLSRRGWTRLFAADPDVVGHRVRISGVPFEVVGVMPDGFRGLSSTPDYWAPLSMMGRLQPSSAGKEAHTEIDIIGRLKPGISEEAATAALTAWVAANPEFKPSRGYPKTAMLIPAATLSDEATQGLLQFAPVFFAFGLILLIGCANVANLLLARGVSRQREIGVRLSLGASRGRIVRQLLTEGLLLALAAGAAGLVIARLALEAAIRTTAGTMGAALADTYRFDVPSTDWRVVAFVFAGAIVSTVAFGLIPALRATRLELVRTMRGEIVADGRPGRSRSALIAVQVGASALLLITSAVFLRGAHAAAGLDAGIRTSDTLTIQIANEPLRAAVVDAIRTDPVVAAAAASNPSPFGLQGAAEVFSPSTRDTVGTVVRGYKLVSPNYFDVLDIGIVRGRGFTPEERGLEAGVAVVSEATADKLWPGGDALGQVIELKSFQEPSSWPRTKIDFTGGRFTVIGVARDAGGNRAPVMFSSFSGGHIYLPANADMAGTSLTVQVRGDTEQARRGLIERLTKVDPAMGAILSLCTRAGLDAYLLHLVFGTTAALGVLALSLTLSGIFSVLSYLIEQQRREIGVRMALGATGRRIVAAVLAQSTRPVVGGLAIGATLAGSVAALLLSSRAAAQISRAIHVFDPLAYAVSLIVVVAACLLAALIPALRASRIDPMAALRQE